MSCRARRGGKHPFLGVLDTCFYRFGRLLSTARFRTIAFSQGLLRSPQTVPNRASMEVPGAGSWTGSFRGFHSKGTATVMESLPA